MPKEKFKTVYVCTSCGEASPRWMGRCPSCGEWNTMVEDIVKETKGKGRENVTIDYEVVTNTKRLFSLKINSSVQINTSSDEAKVYHIDKKTGKCITLEDIFKEDVDYEKIIQSYIMEEIYEILDNYTSHITYDLYELMMESIYICEDPVFYFNGRDLVICISSFELTSQVCNLIEFTISFKKIKNILSDYALKNIFLY